MNSSSELINKLLTIGKKLEETNYASAEPILEQLNVQTLDEAIKILENEKERYSTRNFHPIPAQITILLALAYRIEGDLKTWLQYILRCLHPTYRRYLNDLVQNTFEKHISSCENITIEVKNVPTPFEFSSGFSTHSIMPNQKPTVLLLMKSALKSPLKAKNIIVNVKHSISGVTSHVLIDEFDLNGGSIKKASLEIGKFASGSLNIASISMNLGGATLIFDKFATIGCDEAVIFPFDHECEFSSNIPEFGVVNSPFPIKLLCKDIPFGAIAQHTKIEILNEKDSFNFLNSQNPQIFESSIQTPDKSTETTAEILVKQPCTLEISITASVCFGIVTSKWHKTYSIEFYNAFNSEFTIVNPEFKFSARLPREIVQLEQQAILISTFACNCPNAVTITNIVTKATNNISVIDNPSIFPVRVSSSEVLSYSSFFTPHPGSISGPLGQIEIYFHDKDYNEMKYITILPEINILEKVVDVRLDLPTEIEEKKIYTVNLIGRSMRGPLPVDFILSSSESILFDGETSKKIRLTDQMETLLTLKFMAIKTGTINFPTVSLQLINDRSTAIIWECTPSLFVRYQHD